MTADRQALVPAKPAAVRGAGGGGSKKQRSPIEAPDSLQSIARARILDLIGEGEIEGFASDVPGVVAENALTAIFLDETPVANADGSLNFKDVQVDTRLGTQHQEHIAGFPSVENEIGVGQELTPDAPYVRAINNRDLSAVRLRISTPALSSADSETGDISGISVQYAIDLAVDGGPYRQVLRSALTGKTTSGYERSHRIDLPEATTGWIIRIRRITPMSGSATVADATYVESFTEIVDGKFRYPNSALVGVTVDAAQFGSIPTRAYRVLGRRMAVPSNYDPVTRAYSGSWDGTFKTAWTNNPAWVWYDLVVHDRFGLGDRIDARQVNKWWLYRIAQYCDQLVQDGRGGMEPRFTCHLYLQTRNDALRVLQDLASVFRTMAYWSGGEVVAVADMPADPVYVYTNANVVDGRFTYSGSPGSTRYTVALVSWSDPDDFGRQKIEPVQDEQGLARYGIRQTEVIAIGCQSRGQAQRMGRWILLTSRLETDTVSFGVALDGTIAMPGQIVEIADSLRAQARIGGRVRSATRTVVTVDAAGPIAPGDTLTCVMPDAVSQSRVVEAVAGHEITVASAFTAAPVPDSVWAVSSPTLSTQRVRVLSVRKGEGLEVAITALRHVADKFAAVDHGTTVELPPIVPQLPGKVQLPPTDLQVTHREVATDNAAYLVVSLEWKAPPGAVSYDVEWRQSHGSWTTAGRVYSTTLEVRNALPGPFEFRVVAVNAAGLQSVPAYGGYYEVPPNSAQPGYVEDLLAEQTALQSAIDQEVADRLAEDLRVAQEAASDATGKANAALATAMAAVSSLEAQIADIVGAPEWDVGETYDPEQLVKFDGGLYRALVQTTGNQPDTSPAHWEKVGDYDSLGEAVAAALSLATQTAGELEAAVGRINALYARMPTGSGSLASEAMVLSEAQARATAIAAEATRIDGLVARMPSEGGVLATQASVTTANQARIDGDAALASSITAVQTIANDAQSTAGTALTAANNAASAATTAQTTAGNAQATATQALTASADNATAITQVARQSEENFTSGYGWQFVSDHNGFSADGAVLDMFPPTSNYGATVIAATIWDPNFISPVIAVSGRRNPIVRAMIRRRTDSVWDGSLFWATPAHTFSGDHSSVVSAPPVGEWSIIEWDLTDNTDWRNSTIQRVRFDFAAQAGSAVDVRWIAFGDRGSGSEASATFALQAAQDAQITLTTDVNGHVSGMVSKNDGQTGTFSILAQVFQIIASGSVGLEIRHPRANTYYMRFYAASVQLVLGINFGAAQNLVGWFGSNVGEAACTAANSTFHFTNTGDSYWGGRVLQGVLRWFNSTTENGATASVSTGSNPRLGKPVSLSSRYSYSNRTTYNSGGVVTPAAGNTQVTVQIQRRYGAGAWTTITSQIIQGQAVAYNPQVGTSDPSMWTASMSGEVFATDTASATDSEYRAIISGRTAQTHTGPGSPSSVVTTQYLSIEAME